MVIVQSYNLTTDPTSQKVTPKHVPWHVINHFWPLSLHFENCIIFCEKIEVNDKEKINNCWSAFFLLMTFSCVWHNRLKSFLKKHFYSHIWCSSHGVTKFEIRIFWPIRTSLQNKYWDLEFVKLCAEQLKAFAFSQNIVIIIQAQVFH